MKIYATCDFPCYFKINGEYAGVIDKNLKSFETELENPFFEALPQNNLFLPCYANLLGSSSLKVFKVEKGVLVYPVLKKSANATFKLLGQADAVINGIKTVLSVTVDGNVKFYIDGIIKDVKPLPFIPEKFEIYCENGLIFASFSQEKTALFIYDATTGNLVFSSVVNAFSYSEVLTVQKRFLTTIKTTVIEKWSFKEGAKLISKSDEKERSFFEISPSLIPVAFFESIVIGSSISEIATPSLVKRYEELKDFLGKVIRVIPSPLNDDSVWLVCENEVVKGVAVFENGLISNVLLDDF